MADDQVARGRASVTVYRPSASGDLLNVVTLSTEPPAEVVLTPEQLRQGTIPAQAVKAAGCRTPGRSLATAAPSGSS